MRRMLLSFGLILALTFGGCLQRGHEVSVSTAYDPELTPPDGRNASRAYGLEAGDPMDHPAETEGPAAVVTLFRGEPPNVSGGRSDGAAGTVQLEMVEPGALLDLGSGEKSVRYRVPLDDAGRTSFRVQANNSPEVLLLVGGPLTSRGDCRAAHFAGGLLKDGNVSRPVPVIWSGDRELTVPFGIRCG